MPSGPKKRRAESRKKNETGSKTSTNPTCDEDRVVVAVDSQTVDQKTVETPLMADGFEHLEKSQESKTVDDVNIVTDTSSKKTEPSESDGTGESVLHDLPAMANPVVTEDTVKEVSEHLSSKLHVSFDSAAMVEPVDSDSEGNPDMSSKIPQDSLKKSSKSNVDDPTVFVHQLSSVGMDQNKVGEEMKLLEQLVSISAEIGFQAEKQVALAKEFSLNLSRLLEELKLGRRK